MTRIDTITAIHWQPALNRNESDIVVGLSDIDQAIRLILMTPKGADPHRPHFGSNIYQYLDYPINQIVPHLVREAVDAITGKDGEPRCILKKVTPIIDTSNGTSIELRVEWQLVDGLSQETMMRL